MYLEKQLYYENSSWDIVIFNLILSNKCELGHIFVEFQEEVYGWTRTHMLMTARQGD